MRKILKVCIQTRTILKLNGLTYFLRGQVMSTNRVEDDEKDEIIALNELMVRANITSDNRRYEQLMNTVIRHVP